MTIFDAWEFQTRLALARRNVNHHVADPLIADAKLHWEASGQTAQQALGTPTDFAEAAAAEQPAGYAARRDREGHKPWGYVTGTLFAVSLLVVPWSVLLCLLVGSWRVDITPARIVGALAYVVVVLVLFALTRALRGAGRPRVAPWALAAALLPMAATYVAFRSLSHRHLVTLPVVLLDVLAVVVAISLVWRGEPTPEVAATNEAAGDDPGRWFARLAGLLEGRHDLPRARVADLVQQARTHASRQPAAEFGSPEVYADQLARNETTHHVPAWLNADAPLLLSFSTILGWHQLSEWFSDGHVLRAALTLGFGALVLTRLVQTAARRNRDSGDSSKSLFLRGA